MSGSPAADRRQRSRRAGSVDSEFRPAPWAIGIAPLPGVAKGRGPLASPSADGTGIGTGHLNNARHVRGRQSGFTLEIGVIQALSGM
jgi:hypothetical protein